MASIWLEWLAYFFIAVNFVAFAAFGLDKSFAERGRRRISEKRLISWAVIGGTPGAYAGRHFFRHKTRKASFSEQLHGVALMQLVLLIGGYIYFQID